MSTKFHVTTRVGAFWVLACSSRAVFFFGLGPEPCKACLKKFPAQMAELQAARAAATK